MNTLKKTYKELAIPYFNEVFQSIDEVLRKQKTPYYLIGASAIALEMLKLGTRPARGTKDIDFAVMVSSEDEYESILNELEKKGFSSTNDPWRIRHKKSDVLVDLLPFGVIEENNTVNFKRSKSELHVLGFTEVLEDSIPVEIEEHIADIPPLHGMIILKLIAWSDRPEQRDKDPYDILQIIDKYFDLYSDEIYELHNDLFEEDEFDQLKISSRILGRKAADILKKSDRLKERVLNILSENIQDPKNSKIAEKWAIKHDWEIEYAIKLLEELKSGIIEN
ncbi:MAG: nucleotidyl transferase AbiEii/AbiGii toxin family protein [Bacteroidales bacterium]|nr:nucleotidyl transferase AbiEii/AbiGii toxin family protein [Bacteroidales bacterium]